MTNSTLSTNITELSEACADFIREQKTTDEFDTASQKVLADKENRVEMLCKEFFDVRNITPRSFSILIDNDSRKAIYAIDWVGDTLVGISAYPCLIRITPE